MRVWKQPRPGPLLAALALGTVAAGFGPTQSWAQVAPPPGWRWGTDHPARMSSEWNLPDSTWRFVQMAPGWHITTRPGALMYDPSVQATGTGQSLDGFFGFRTGPDLNLHVTTLDYTRRLAPVPKN